MADNRRNNHWPIAAVQVQKWVEKWREEKDRRLWIFKTLMATRGAKVSFNHVQALNLIELDFDTDNEKDKQVRLAWKKYLDALHQMPTNPASPTIQFENTIWTQKIDEALAQLLYEMSRALGYKFDIVDIRNGGYTPIGHEEYENDHRAIRRGLVQILYYNKKIPIEVFMPPPSSQPIEPVQPRI